MNNKLTILLFISCYSALVSCTVRLNYQSEIQENVISQEYKNLTVTIKEPGTLESLLREVDYHYIIKLTVNGPINGDDLKYIRLLAGTDEYGNETDGTLSRLDLSQAMLVEGGDPYFIYKGENGEEPCYLKSNEVSCYAFGYCKLSEIILPDNIVKFSSQAFYSCKQLRTINIPKSLKFIGKSAFCYCNALTSDVVIPDGMTAIADYMFYECWSIKSITIPKTVTSFGESCFCGCKNIRSFNELPNLKTFGEECFANCTHLESFNIPSTMTSIPAYAFSGCSQLAEVNISHIKTIGYKAFYYCSMLKSVDFSNELEYVDHYAFMKSGLAMDLVLPPTVKFIGYQAFSSTELTSVTINSDIRTLESEDIRFDNPASFGSCKILTKLVVADGCTFLGLSFSGCSSLVDVKLPNSLDSLGYVYKTQHIPIVGKDEPWIEYTANDEIFSGCTSLQEIDLPPNLKYIGSQCFRSCNNLRNIVIPNSVTYLGTYVFDGCTSLSDVCYTENFKVVPQGCFSGCTSLHTIELPDSIMELEYGCFENSGLESISMSSSLVELGNNCFYNCYNLKNIILPPSLEIIKDYAFAECSELQNVDFSTAKELTTIGKASFYHCTNLKQVLLPDGIQTIEEYSFSLCGMEGLSIPASLQAIGGGSFEGCQRLSNIWNYSTIPQPININTFGMINLEAITLYVPSESLDLYRQNPIWQAFPNITNI